ncbi:hypothetical protein BDEG_28379 [Batrachochytrium dendrobatidis JEL423]|nr:hypothetical protein BDEG_28379 [Batrachochytrium dendrobatidis JEL423]
MYSGGLFVKFSREDAHKMLKEDLVKINSEIDKCNDNIRKWTIELEQAERGAASARLQGLELKGISRSEMESLSQFSRRS